MSTLGVCLILYFLPTIIAMLRFRHNRAAIMVLNTFLGWTGLFWVLALVWAVSSLPPNARA
jgi:hypothetical protein